MTTGNVMPRRFLSSTRSASAGSVKGPRAVPLSPASCPARDIGEVTGRERSDPKGTERGSGGGGGSRTRVRERRSGGPYRLSLSFRLSPRRVRRAGPRAAIPLISPRGAGRPAGPSRLDDALSAPRGKGNRRTGHFKRPAATYRWRFEFPTMIIEGRWGPRPATSAKPIPSNPFRPLSLDCWQP